MRCRWEQVNNKNVVNRSKLLHIIFSDWIVFFWFIDCLSFACLFFCFSWLVERIFHRETVLLFASTHGDTHAHFYTESVCTKSRYVWDEKRMPQVNTATAALDLRESMHIRGLRVISFSLSFRSRLLCRNGPVFLVDSSWRSSRHKHRKRDVLPCVVSESREGRMEKRGDEEEEDAARKELSSQTARTGIWDEG